MRATHSSYSASLSYPLLRITELYTIELASGQTFYYTPFDSVLSWDSPSHSYQPLPISRGPVRYGLNLEMDTVDIWLANISGDLYATVQANILDNAKVTIKRIFWNETQYAANKEITVFVGTADIEFDRNVLICHCRPIIDNLNIQVPRHTFQEPCNRQLYGDGCSLTRANYAYGGTATGGTATTVVDTTRGDVYSVAFDAGDSANAISIADTITGSIGAGTGVVVNIVYLTATTGTIWYVEQAGLQFVNDEVLDDGAGNTVTVNGTPAVETTLYEIGELEMTGGVNDGHRRPILSDAAGVVTVAWAFPAAVAAGDTYNIYPGCDKKAATCTARFNNDANFRGFLYVPRVEETLM